MGVCEFHLFSIYLYSHSHASVIIPSLQFYQLYIHFSDTFNLFRSCEVLPTRCFIHSQRQLETIQFWRYGSFFLRSCWNVALCDGSEKHGNVRNQESNPHEKSMPLYNLIVTLGCHLLAWHFIPIKSQQSDIWTSCRKTTAILGGGFHYLSALKLLSKQQCVHLLAIRGGKNLKSGCNKKLNSFILCVFLAQEIC